MIDIKDLRGQVLNALASSGCFDNVLGHEPKAAPTREGVTAAVWNVGLTFVQSSGLNSLSARVEAQVRVYTSMLSEPQDDIDPAVMDAADKFIAWVVSSFTLGSRLRYVDFLGADGEGFRAQTGYLTQDQKPFRVMDIFIPMIINDAYSLSA